MNQSRNNKYQFLKEISKLLYPGIGLKRWLISGSIGIGLLSVGLAYSIRKIVWFSFSDLLPGQLESLILIVIGIAIVIGSIYGIYKSIGPFLLQGQSFDNLANTIYTEKNKEKGPKIVAIGGGTGLSVLLRGLKNYSNNISAIITVSDDGGSSGRLRRELGVIPPGDFRNCLVALSDTEPLLAELFQYRFNQGDGLKGHSFGNLFIAAMNDLTRSFPEALMQSSKILAVKGEIIPATLQNLKLTAKLEDGEEIQGESYIGKTKSKIKRLSINPINAKAYPPALNRIKESDIIIIGPGSLYTSIIPNLSIKDITKAINESKACKVYVCNIATQIGETNGYSMEEHIKSLQKHTIPTIADYVLVNNHVRELDERFFGEPVINNKTPIEHVKIIESDIGDETHPIRHDSNKLTKNIIKLYENHKYNNS